MPSLVRRATLTAAHCRDNDKGQTPISVNLKHFGPKMLETRFPPPQHVAAASGVAASKLTLIGQTTSRRTKPDRLWKPERSYRLKTRNSLRFNESLPRNRYDRTGNGDLGSVGSVRIVPLGNSSFRATVTRQAGSWRENRSSHYLPGSEPETAIRKAVPNLSEPYWVNAGCLNSFEKLMPRCPRNTTSTRRLRPTSAATASE